MTNLLVAADARDAAWVVRSYRESESRRDAVRVFAPCFAAQETLLCEGVPFETFEELAWALPKHQIYDRARRIAWEWFQLPELAKALEPVREYKGYPLMEMHWSLLLLSMKEVLESHAFAASVLDAIQPKTVTCGDRGNPFARYWLAALTGDRGLEPEAMRSLCAERGIHLALAQKREGGPTAKPHQSSLSYRDKALHVARRCKWKTIGYFMPPPWKGGFRFPKRLTGARVLVYTWGGYYFKQVAPAIRELAAQGARVGVALHGGMLNKEERRECSQLGVQVFNNQHWPVEHEMELAAHWERLGETAFSAIRDNSALRRLFTGDDGCFLPELGELALERELVKALPDTVVRLARAEKVVESFAPDVVFSHFAQHPQGVAETLAARRRGIPTVNCGHGNPPGFAAVRNTFATHHVATAGNRFAGAMVRTFPHDAGRVQPVGDARLETALERSADREKAAAALGLDPQLPICVFCDMTGWTTKTTIWRHATRAAVEQAVALSQAVPGMQLVYRVHHGGEYNMLRQRLERECPGVVFQLTSDVPLTDMLGAADVVVSHACSAVTEALTQGVRVVFLCSHGDALPDYDWPGIIGMARTEGDLHRLVRECLQTPMEPETVRRRAAEFFDHALCGLDGKASERLARLVLEAKDAHAASGWDDWLERIEASCRVESEILLTPDGMQQEGG